MGCHFLLQGNLPYPGMELGEFPPRGVGEGREGIMDDSKSSGQADLAFGPLPLFQVYPFRLLALSS